MNDPTNDNDIDALLRWMACDFGDDDKWLLAVTALVAERDSLKQRVAELEAQPPAASDRDLRAKIDKLSSSVSILTCRVAALESAKYVCPHVPMNPWNPYPTTPWVIYGTRTSDRIEESA